MSAEPPSAAVPLPAARPASPVPAPGGPDAGSPCAGSAAALAALLDRTGAAVALLHCPTPQPPHPVEPVLAHVGQAFAGRIGLTPDQLAGTCLRPLLEEQAAPAAAVSDLLSAIGRDIPCRLTLWVRRGDGAPELLELEGLPLGGAAGGSGRYYGLIGRHDSGHEVEGRLRNAVESLNDAFMLLDDQDRVVLFNRRYVEVYPELTNHLRPGVHIGDLTRIALQIGLFPEAVGREEEFLADRMRRLHHPDGPHEHRLASGRWVRISETRTPDGWTVSVRTDVTVEKEHAAGLMEEKLRAEASSQAKSRFLSAMSHELRTPLNLILGFSDMLRQPDTGPPDPGHRSYAEDIHSAGDYLLELINDILDMSKIEAGKYELRIGGVAVYRLLQDTTRLMRQQAHGSGLTLDLDLAPDLPPRIRADGRALRQVLLNLLSNAIKFTRSGGGITVRARAGGGHLEITVTDTGIGIPASQLTRLGQPFEQVDNALNRQHPGTGLGLALSKSLVELHGGRLAIDSELGRGTSVTVTLPVQVDR